MNRFNFFDFPHVYDQFKYKRFGNYGFEPHFKFFRERVSFQGLSCDDLLANEFLCELVQILLNDHTFSSTNWNFNYFLFEQTKNLKDVLSTPYRLFDHNSDRSKYLHDFFTIAMRVLNVALGPFLEIYKALNIYILIDNYFHKT